MTEDGVTASGYGAENAWEVRAVRYSPVGDEVIPSNAKHIKLVIKRERDSRYNQAENCTRGSPRTVTQVIKH